MALVSCKYNPCIYILTASHSFFPCGSEGRKGPTSEKCKLFYRTDHTPVVNVTIDDVNMPGVQKWKVPNTTEYG